jgi:hypothetical protein
LSLRGALVIAGFGAVAAVCFGGETRLGVRGAEAADLLAVEV